MFVLVKQKKNTAAFLHMLVLRAPRQTPLPCARNAPRRVCLGDLGNTVRAGRCAKRCNLVLDAPRQQPGMVSRLHALFTLCGSQTRQVWRVQDMHSTNGLLVNDCRLTGGVARVLQSGDVVTFGLGKRGERGLCEYTFHEHAPVKHCRIFSQAGQSSPMKSSTTHCKKDILKKRRMQSTSRAASPTLPSLLFSRAK